MNKQIDKTNKNEVATLSNNNLEGLEDIDASDIVIPRAKLLQGGSDQIKNPDDYPDLKVGMIVNSVTFEELIKDKDNNKAYPFIPVKMFKSWCKFSADMQLEEKSYDSNSDLARSPDAWQYRQLNFLGFQPLENKPIVFTFWRSSYKVGQDIINIAQLRRQPLYNNLLHISSKNESKEGNDFRVYSVTHKGDVDKEIQKVGKQMYNEFNAILDMMKQNSLKIADEAQESTQSNTPPWEE